jgi:hypothetical protein
MVRLKKHRNLTVPPVLINNNRFESSDGAGATFDSAVSQKQLASVFTRKVF